MADGGIKNFGEMGNLSFLRPNYAKAVADTEGNISKKLKSVMRLWMQIFLLV